MESLRPAYPAPRRVATAPVPTHLSRPAPSTSAGGLVETLYNHPNVKIVAFAAASRGRARSPGRGPSDEPGSLSAHSQLERTIAIGPFRIYRTGSVAFLNCGSALQPMLPKSQCWALAEDSSKFVLQIRRPNYWRIEIPVTNADELELAAALKGVWDQILQFEKTECPFKRSFTVILPEKPKTPVKKRPWTPPVKRALPVLSTPAHEVEVSPTPKALTPNTGRRASTSSLRGRSEQRRLSTVSNDFHSTSRSREPSAEIPKAAEPSDAALTPTAERPAVATELKIPKRGAEATRNFDSNNTTQEVTEQGGPTCDLVRIEKNEPKENHEDSIFEDSIAEEVEPEDDAQQTDLKAPAEEPSTKSLGIQVAGGGIGAQDNAGKEVTAAAVSSASRFSPLHTTVTAPSTETDDCEKIAQSPRVPQASIKIDDSLTQPKKNQTDIQVETVMTVERPVAGRRLQNDIKEQLVTVEALPKTPPSAEASTPTPTNIYDVIRNYEIKMAAATPESTLATEPVAEPETVCEKSAVETANTSGNGSSSESQYATDEEAVLEGSGVVGGRRKKLRGFRAGRALVPPQLTLVTSPPSKSAMRSTPILDETTSPTGSTDSFHSSKSWHSPAHSPITPVPRSPASDVSPTRFPYPHDNILIPKKPWHYRDISDLTVTPETRRTWDATSSLTDDSSLESAATAPDMVSEVVEQPDKVALSEDEAATTAVVRRPYIRHRSTTSSISVGRRALSPLPTAANLFAPTSTQARYHPLRSRLELVRRLPMAIVSKTCEVLLGPPSHLIALMLQVAAKIAAGQWRGMMFGFGEGGETIPVQWDYSDDEYDSWGENDDYYLSQVESSRANSVIGTDDGDNDEATDNANGTGRGWEVD
ncbi:inheritance of peroxisomes protein 1-domain-containing protein [Colletotrichum godetiae]|uniref:Inheritance of peroxisomes protein 1 n=1 Tax=Colletotrichum godetiae TaxID=1209918 RepID=A0AAJ0AFS4_9PEZI|nr:inheritance of peroxisomes protein 1-domain-containing protein [Colletotrichum godetiae]KAK1673080.1 inheritance of peroxisomes protein 1-domain-containing protein [Colletotrichum godetiae]